MKIRNGFVSNSSSSSYTIVMKGDPTKERFLDILGLREGSPLYNAYGELFNYCINSEWGWLATNEEEFLNALKEQYHIDEIDIQPGGNYHDDGEWLDQLKMIKTGHIILSILLSDNECDLEVQYGGMLRCISDSDHIRIMHDPR